MTYHARETIAQQKMIPRVLEEYGYGANQVQYETEPSGGSLVLKIPIELEIVDRLLKKLQPGEKARPAITSPGNGGTPDPKPGPGKSIQLGPPTLYEEGHDFGISVTMKRRNQVTGQYHKACKRVRWIQTVRKQVGDKQAHFVDVSGKLPFYGTGALNPNGEAVFDDAPCTGPDEVTHWSAVLSLVTWEGEKNLHIHQAVRYGYRVTPSGKQPVVNVVAVTPASKQEIKGHQTLVEGFGSGFKFI